MNNLSDPFDVAALRTWLLAALPADADGVPRLLACVSGGADSMTLWHLIRAAGIPHEVLHVNYGLRGDASDGDELLVSQTAAKEGVRLHVHRVRLAPGPGLQAHARATRQTAAEVLLRKRGLTRVALGHHLDDQAETVLMRLSRGTGGVGLAGMRPIVGPLLRPLLTKTRAEVAAFAKTHDIPYRNDATNAGTDYHRNAFRHRVLPPLLAVEPRTLGGIGTAAAHQADLIDFARGQAREVLAKARLPPAHVPEAIAMSASTGPGGAPEVFDRRRLASVTGLRTLLYFWLDGAGFRSAQLVTLAAWITDGESARRTLERPDRGAVVIVAGARVWRKTHPSGE